MTDQIDELKERVARWMLRNWLSLHGHKVDDSD